MDSHRDIPMTDDLSALAWVQEELRRSLDAAHKALRRTLREAESLQGADVDAIDPAVLRAARQQMHQGVGALELAGLPAVAAVLRASEAAVQRFIAKPQKLNAEVVDTIERTSFALLDYLSRLLAGKPLSAVALFPQYRAMQELAGAGRVHPADLWLFDWRWHALPEDPSIAPQPADARARSELEVRMLELMRQGGPAVATAASDLFAALGNGADDAHLATLWRLAAAVYEAQAQGLLKADNYNKRLASRLLSQIRLVEQGEGLASERLAQDLLFFCAQAASPGDGRKAPRLAGVRQAYELSHELAAPYDVARLGRFDPALLVQARKRVVAAKEAWSAVAGGELHRLGGLGEQFQLVADSVRKIYPNGDALADELGHAVADTVQRGAAPSPSLAMEVATSVLYVEASLEDGELDHPEFGLRMQRLAGRVASVRSGRQPEPLEPWMEELYRRVSDRQTMGSVVQELRASLAEAEKQIDQYFRNPAQRESLMPVPGQLGAMRGVLSVLGMDHAASAVLRMRDEVDAWIAAGDTSPEASTPLFERLANNLGALGFLIDMLSVQPQMAKSLFVFDAEAGTLNPVMGRHRATVEAHPPQARLIEQVQALAAEAVREDVPVADVARQLERLSHEAQMADQPTLVATVAAAKQALERAEDAFDESAAREQLALAMSDFVVTSSDDVSLQGASAPAPVPPASATPVPAGQTGLEADDEMLEIFLEEAQEVLGNADAALVELRAAPDSVEQLTVLRRAFHTLKGSSRMVGLDEFGEAAWAGEQLYNTRLADAPHADEALLSFSAECFAYLGQWVERIAAKLVPEHRAADVRAAADALRLHGERRALPLPVDGDATITSSFPDLGLPEVEAIETFGAVDNTAATGPEEQVAFDASAPLDFDLSEPAASAPAPIKISDADAAAIAAARRVVDPDAVDLSDAHFDHAVPPVDVAAPRDEGDVELIELDFGEAAGEPPAKLPGVTDLDLVLDDGPADALGAATDIELPDLNLDEIAPATATPVMAADDADAYRQIGPLRVPVPLYNIYVGEADDLSRRLGTELGEWALELPRVPDESTIALAHSLAGSSATVGYGELSQLARALEHALMRVQAIGDSMPSDAGLFIDVADEIRQLLHQFAGGFLKSPAATLWERLAEHERSSVERLEAAQAAADAAPLATDAIDMPIEIDVLPSTSDELIEPGPDDLVADTGAVPLEESKAAVAPPASVEASAPSAPAVPAPTVAAAPVAAVEPARSAALPTGWGDLDGEIDAVDAVDEELFPIFEEEGQELLPQLASRLRDWHAAPGDASLGTACMRTLHTLKGGARLAGAMRLGELAHRLETAIEHLLARGTTRAAEIELVQARADALVAAFEAMCRHGQEAYDQAQAQSLAPAPAAAAAAAAPAAAAAVPSGAVEAVKSASTGIDWQRFGDATDGLRALPERSSASGSHSTVRVRTPLLDRLVNNAGEVSITRSRIESDVTQLRQSLDDLRDNLDRLRGQLRDIELQAETQMASRLEAAKQAAEAFDPLEFDRFTRFQELTRMMAESVNDVATVQRTLNRTLESTEDELAAQARLTRELQDDLLRTRMVEFDGLSDRLYRVVRQAAKETGKQVRLDMVGGQIEVDRGVLDRMTGAFEHLLRNCVTHGIESPAARTKAGKEATGTIVVALKQEGNEVAIEVRDDGQGLDLERIRSKGVETGLLARDAQLDERALSDLIFTPGFSTAETVTELAGRGIGMDVVRSEVVAMGGRVETHSVRGEGTRFRLVLPLTTAVTQVVMLRCGQATVAVPSTLIEIVRRAKPAEVEAAYAQGSYTLGSDALPFYWLGGLLQMSPRGGLEGRSLPLVVIRSAQQRIVLHVDEVLGNQEVVVKNLGPQLARIPGLAGMTLLPSGSPALIYNPVALATLYGDAARTAMLQPLAPVAPVTPSSVQGAPTTEATAPLVLVVDDSLTVRRVTQRLLLREGFRVVLAKDGLDALERLAELQPDVVLSDIEMPRMDGFDLVRNMRGEARWRELPVIMITSRIAQKHRDHAQQLGVDHYLGKPYSEDELLGLIHSYCRAREESTS